MISYLSRSLIFRSTQATSFLSSRRRFGIISDKIMGAVTGKIENNKSEHFKKVMVDLNFVTLDQYY